MILMELVGSIADILGIIGAIAAVFAWLSSSTTNKMLELERKRQNQKIKVILENNKDGQILQLPVQLRREEFSRAEVLGRIGMIPIKKNLLDKGQKRFSIKYLNNPGFLQQIDEIRENGRITELRIECDRDEFHQFET